MKDHWPEPYPSERGAAWALLLWLLAAAPAAQSASWSSTNVQILHGTTYEVGRRERGIMTLEHASVWAYGDNFFFFDFLPIV